MNIYSYTYLFTVCSLQRSYICPRYKQNILPYYTLGDYLVTTIFWVADGHALWRESSGWLVRPD